MVFEQAIKGLSTEVLNELLDSAKGSATDGVESGKSNKYIQDQLVIAEICERELLTRKLS
jgi:hypothetical protein